MKLLTALLIASTSAIKVEAPNFMTAPTVEIWKYCNTDGNKILSEAEVTSCLNEAAE